MYINKITHKEEKKEEVPTKPDDIVLLEEIRDLLKEKTEDSIHEEDSENDKEEILE